MTLSSSTDSGGVGLSKARMPVRMRGSAALLSVVMAFPAGVQLRAFVDREPAPDDEVQIVDHEPTTSPFIDGDPANADVNRFVVRTDEPASSFEDAPGVVSAVQ